MYLATSYLISVPVLTGHINDSTLLGSALFTASSCFCLALIIQKYSMAELLCRVIYFHQVKHNENILTTM